jgi:hypothetical protein
MKTLLKVLGVATLLLLFTGCENVQMGVGVSGYNSSTGMSYGFGVSDGPYGRHSSATVGYSSGGYYGRPPYGRW